MGVLKDQRSALGTIDGREHVLVFAIDGGRSNLGHTRGPDFIGIQQAQTFVKTGHERHATGLARSRVTDDDGMQPGTVGGQPCVFSHLPHVAAGNHFCHAGLEVVPTGPLVDDIHLFAHILIILKLLCTGFEWLTGGRPGAPDGNLAGVNLVGIFVKKHHEVVLLVLVQLVVLAKQVRDKGGLKVQVVAVPIQRDVHLIEPADQHPRTAKGAHFHPQVALLLNIRNHQVYMYVLASFRYYFIYNSLNGQFGRALVHAAKKVVADGLVLIIVLSHLGVDEIVQKTLKFVIDIAIIVLIIVDVAELQFVFLGALAFRHSGGLRILAVHIYLANLQETVVFQKIFENDFKRRSGNGVQHILLVNEPDGFFQLLRLVLKHLCEGGLFGHKVLSLCVKLQI